MEHGFCGRPTGRRNENTTADDHRRLQPGVLAIAAGHRLRGEDVVTALNRVVAKRTVPKCLFVDKGSEFPGQMLGLQADRHRSKIDSAGPANRLTNAISRPSTDRYVMNALTSTGSPPLPRVRPSWRHGALTTMRFGLTWLSQTKLRRPSLGARLLESLKQAIDRPDSQVQSVHQSKRIRGRTPRTWKWTRDGCA